MDNHAERELPWWQNSRTVTILGSLVAAVMPMTTFVGGYLQKETELQLNAQKQSHAIRLDYLDRVFRPGITEAEQELIFSLFADMDDQPAIQKWAKSRGASLQQEITRLQSEIEEKKNREKAAKDELQLAVDKLAALSAAAGAASGSPEALASLRQDILQEKELLASASVAKDELSREVTRLQVRTGDPAAAPAATLDELVNSVGSTRKSERLAAVQQIIDGYKYNPKTIPLLLSLFDAGNISSLSASGRYNALYILTRMSNYAWNKPLINAAEKVLAQLEKRHDAGISPLGPQSMALIKELREHLGRLRESPAAWG